MKQSMKWLAAAGLLLVMTGCGASGKAAVQAESEKAEQAVTRTSNRTQKNKSKGEKLTTALGRTSWQGTRVYDEQGNDLTAENSNFIGLAKYDDQTGRYEFFDAETGASRGDQGIFFVTGDGAKRVLISETMNYQAVVDITELNKEIFTYKRQGKDAAGKELPVYVEHAPYKERKLTFTDPDKVLNTSTGKIEKNRSGSEILGETLWHGTKVLDEQGGDVTAYNQNFISLAKFDGVSGKYEFFNLKTGASRGDYGYFSVVNKNKLRVHASLGQNKYGAILELTELNKRKFTYKRVGKNQAGQDITVFVEHEPYQGAFTPVFSF